MEPSRPASLFFLMISIQLCAFTFVQSDKLIQQCTLNSNFTVNSSYGNNLNQLFSTITSDSQTDFGFYNLSYGKNSDRVNSIGLCRGDMKPDSCRSCIINATQEFRRLCPNQMEGIVWYDECMLRYSNRSIFGKMEFEPYQALINVNNASDVNQFKQALTPLLDVLRTQAASGNSLRKFSAGKADTSGSETIYAAAQCTPDLSRGECNNCVSNATALLSQCCVEKQGARVLTPSCNVRYEIYMFYDPSVDTQPPMVSPVPAPSILAPPPPMVPVAPAPSISAPPPPMVSPAAQTPSISVPPPPQPNYAARKGSLNGRLQVLGTVVPLMILQYSAF